MPIAHTWQTFLSNNVAGRKILYYVTPSGQQRPIQTLPEELLSRIFELANLAEMESSEAKDELEYLSQSDLPQIDWDTVVVEVEAKPNLVELLKDTEFAEDERRKWHWLDEPFERSQEWIVRSKQAPLHVKIDIQLSNLKIFLRNTGRYTGINEIQASELLHEYGATPDDADLRKTKWQRENLALRDLVCMLNLLIPHVARWGSFDFTTDSYELIFYLLARLAACGANPGALQLAHLRVIFDGSFENITSSEYEIFDRDLLRKYFFLFGGNVPRLTTMELKQVHIDWESLIAPSHRSVPSLEYSYPSTNITKVVHNNKFSAVTISTCQDICTRHVKPFPFRNGTAHRQRREH
ncbi:hypothetical protein EW145_g2488 [Phellinidium pouzarii]|uniref:F-box domain-containing protein n=1 Tax=Phellinidium pouzarii TaxID=167371 RepID=A0A4S4LCM1_9AGAM|nr:hypothetical protein EW145_g2488 [Phellinidium pouzarii]